MGRLRPRHSDGPVFRDIRHTRGGNYAHGIPAPVCAEPVRIAGGAGEVCARAEIYRRQLCEIRCHIGLYTSLHLIRPFSVLASFPRYGSVEGCGKRDGHIVDNHSGRTA